MKYKIEKDKIIVEAGDDFDIEHILECGQIFRFYKFADGSYSVCSGDKFAKIMKNNKNYVIFSKDAGYFADFFDLETDYSKIKNELKKDKVLAKTIPFGKGIRILKNNPLEMIFSFVISANNRIPRIKKIIEAMCEKAGENMGEYYAFPTIEKLASLPLNFYLGLGAGYRAKYLFKLARELSGVDLNEKNKLETKELRNWLISLSGVGPKVADCILLFGFNRMDVFPIDTWTSKVYETFYNEGAKTREQMREHLVKRFGIYSGYAQQYLFYGARSYDVLKLKI